MRTSSLHNAVPVKNLVIAHALSVILPVSLRREGVEEVRKVNVQLRRSLKNENKQSVMAVDAMFHFTVGFDFALLITPE